MRIVLSVVNQWESAGQLLSGSRPPPLNTYFSLCILLRVSGNGQSFQSLIWLLPSFIVCMNAAATWVTTARAVNHLEKAHVTSTTHGSAENIHRLYTGRKTGIKVLMDWENVCFLGVETFLQWRHWKPQTNIFKLWKGTKTTYPKPRKI